MSDDHGSYFGMARCTYCGKLIYASRKIARTAAKKIHGKSQHFSAYECRQATKAGFTNMWHIGHLPKMIITGQAKRP